MTRNNQTSKSKYSTNDKRKLDHRVSFEVCVADWGMKTIRDDWGRPKGEARDKQMEVINLFSGKIEKYVLESEYNRITSIRSDPEYAASIEGKSDFEIMSEYVDDCLLCNGFNKARIVKDVIEGNNESAEADIEREVQYRVARELERRGIKVE